MICIRNLRNAQLYIYTLFSITDANLYKNYTSAKFSLNKFAKFWGGHPRADVFQKTAKFEQPAHLILAYIAECQ